VEEPSRASHPQRIFLVNDNAGALGVLADALTARGHEVRSASDAVDALEALRTFDPEIAIIELGLPVVDGYELAAQIRAEYGAAMRIIAVAGYGQSIDLERLRAAGFDAHLLKPVAAQDVVACLREAR
jgi:CheY-like chemotaxis protein